MSEHDLIIVFCTCGSEKNASQIADKLVSHQLAACVNMLPGIESVYQWQEQIQRDKEVLLIIKTQQDRYSELEQVILELHDYELPEIITVPIEAGYQAYLKWITSATEK